LIPVFYDRVSPCPEICCPFRADGIKALKACLPAGRVNKYP